MYLKVSIQASLQSVVNVTEDLLLQNFNHFINCLSFLNGELDEIPRGSYLKYETIVTIAETLTQCQRCCLGDPFLPFCLCLSVFVFLSSCVCMCLSVCLSFFFSFSLHVSVCVRI